MAGENLEATRESPFVSVVVPTFNRAATLRRAIDSVLCQTYTHFELLVCDDGSTDRTAEVVAAVKDPRLHYLAGDRNRGQAAARNRGIAAARGDLIAFHDSDDEWLPHKLERHVSAFGSAHVAVDVTYSDMTRIYKNGQEIDCPAPTVVPRRLIDPATRFWQVYGIGIQSTVMRRTCFEAGYRFDEAFRALEDLDLLMRLSHRFAFLHIPESLVRYHQNEGVTTNRCASLRARVRLLGGYAWPLLRRHPRFVVAESWRIAATLAGVR